MERYLPDGSLDGGFGSNGIVETDLGLQPPRDQNGQQILERPWVQATGVAVDSQGRIVLTGGAAAGLVFGCVHDNFSNTLTYAGLVARLTEIGSLDSSFGGGDGVSGGVNREENALTSELTAAPVVTPGGMLTFAPGPVICPRDELRPGIAELNEAGEPQLSFGIGGRVPGVWDAAAPGGSIVTLNWRLRFPGPVRGEVKRLQPDGAPDPGFGQGGSTSLVVRGGDRTQLSAVAVDPWRPDSAATQIADGGPTNPADRPAGSRPPGQQVPGPEARHRRACGSSPRFAR